MDYGLQDRLALVAGGGSGIGLEAGRLLAREGARVVLADMDAEALAQGMAELREEGLEPVSIECDITDPASVQSMAERILTDHGPVEILVNSAGIVGDKLFVESRPEDWKREIDVSLLGPMHCIQALLPAMIERGRGRIITLSSDAARIGQARLSYYAAAKAGAAAFSKSLAQEVGRHGITVNVVSPGATDTPLRQRREQGFREKLGEEGYAERNRKVLRGYPLGRIGAVGDVAAAIVYLASDQAAWITGQVLSVNGGFVMP